MNASCTRFREEITANPYIFKYWQFATNRFFPMKRSGKFFFLTERNVLKPIEETLNDAKVASICLNDTPLCTDNDFEYLSKFYLALIEDNNVVPAEVKFSVCRSLVDFGFIVEREYAELDPAVIASFNQTVQTFLSCVEKDLYAKRLSKESIEAKRVYLEEGSKLGLDTSQEDFYIHRFIPELQRIRLECREGNWFPPSMYFPFYRRQLQVFTEPLVAGLIKAIKGNPFEKKGEKAK